MNYNFRPTKVYIDKIEGRIKDAIDFIDERSNELNNFCSDYISKDLVKAMFGRIVKILKGDKL